MKISKETQSEIYRHAEEEFPNESCGVIVDGKYIKCTNIAENREDNFEISVNEIGKFIQNDLLDAVIHSHNNNYNLSEEDMKGQIRSAVPWGLVNVVNGTVRNIHFWGDSLPVSDLVGREFIHGSQDCYGLVRDYYRLKNILIKQFPRENNWWKSDKNLLCEDNFKSAGFEKIEQKDLQEGDVILLKIRSKYVNHSAIYLKNGLILHHLSDRLSIREPVHIWNKYITCFLRYKGE